MHTVRILIYFFYVCFPLNMGTPADKMSTRRREFRKIRREKYIILNLISCFKVSCTLPDSSYILVNLFFLAFLENNNVQDNKDFIPFAVC